MPPSNGTLAFGFDWEKFAQRIEAFGDRPLTEEFLKLLNNFLSKHTIAMTPSQFRLRVNQFIAKLTAHLAPLDCVFLRRLRSDGSAELILGTVNWCSDEQLGSPPRVKNRDDGVSTWWLNSGNVDPCIFPDLSALPAMDPLRESHRQAIARFTESGDLEGAAFLSKVRGEICVPLAVKGRVFGVVVGVRLTPYAEEEVEGIRSTLQEFQVALSFLYYIGLELDHRDNSQALVGELPTTLRRLGNSLTEYELLLRLLTLLTCQPGLRWHRAMIFALGGPWPSDAHCVMALGGDGRKGWERIQDAAIQKFVTIADYLSDAFEAGYGIIDPLFCRVTTGTPFLIPQSALAECETISQVFTHRQNQQEDVQVISDLTWLQRVPDFAPFVPETQDEHYRLVLVPLRNLNGTPIGFVLLDNPYAKSVELAPDPQLAALVCQVAEAHLASRGFGTKRWIECYCSELQTATQSFVIDLSAAQSTELASLALKYINPSKLSHTTD